MVDPIRDTTGVRTPLEMQFQVQVLDKIAPLSPPSGTGKLDCSMDIVAAQALNNALGGSDQAVKTKINSIGIDE